MEKLKTVRMKEPVTHEGITYIKDEEYPMGDKLISALGNSVEVVHKEEETTASEDTTKDEQDEKVETKQTEKAPQNKMVNGATSSK